MTRQEYEQKREQEWRTFCNRHGMLDRGHVMIISAFFDAFDRAFALGKQEKDAEDDRTLKVNRQLFCRLCADADDYINEHLEEDDSDYGYYQGRSDALHELYRGECKDAEGEEMLTVSRKEVRSIYDHAIGLITKTRTEDENYKLAMLEKTLMEELFGSKCLPDEKN